MAELTELSECFSEGSPPTCDAWEFPGWRLLAKTEDDEIEDPDCFAMSFPRAKKLDEQLVSQRQAKRRKLGDARLADDEEEQEEEDILVDMAEVDSDEEVVASDLGSDVEKVCEKPLAEADVETDDEDGHKVPRAARGTHVVRRNPYFYMANNPRFVDC